MSDFGDRCPISAIGIASYDYIGEALAVPCALPIGNFAWNQV